MDQAGGVLHPNAGINPIVRVSPSKFNIVTVPWDILPEFTQTEELQMTHLLPIQKHPPLPRESQFESAINAERDACLVPGNLLGVAFQTQVQVHLPEQISIIVEGPV